MALQVTIVDSEYKVFNGRDHLYYIIHICQPNTKWEGNVELRYSVLKYAISLNFKIQNLFLLTEVIDIYTNRFPEAKLSLKRHLSRSFQNG